MVFGKYSNTLDAAEQDSAWAELRTGVLADPYFPFDVHREVYRLTFDGRKKNAGPPPAWSPAPEYAAQTNIGRMMRELNFRRYDNFHRWSVQEHSAFWARAIEKVGIKFKREPHRIVDISGGVESPDWLPGAEMNIVDSCFKADPERTALVYDEEGGIGAAELTYGRLGQLVNRVARAADELLGKDDRVALYMPMTPESIAAYLGIIKSGRAVVGIADTAAPEELRKKVELGGASAVITIDSYRKDGRVHKIYEKVTAAGIRKAVVVPSRAGEQTPLRGTDMAWDDFLSESTVFESVPKRPSDITNILFSSGTTKDPKVIPWTHVTPIKSIVDGYFHHDIQPDDTLAWPTSFGWMMGPWLTYAGLVNNATMAVFNGSAVSREFGEFVSRRGVTMLGTVPKLVKKWRESGVMERPERVDWSKIKLFSSTGETSNPEDYLWLMWLAGYKPVVEYCGGTEIGGGYITGTLMQPASPGTFSTAALGLDFVLFDEERRFTEMGEVGLVPPSIGLSDTLLNYDHRAEYFEGMPRGPCGDILRRHGDHVEALGRGYFRHHGRMDDMINIGGVKTSSEQVRHHLLSHPGVADCKPFSVDVDGSGQHVLVVYVVPRDLGGAGREKMADDFNSIIKKGMDPLLAHVRDVVLVDVLPQAGPGKTMTTKEFRKDYMRRMRGAVD